jgi:copper chaperone CopZ
MRHLQRMARRALRRAKAESTALALHNDSSQLSGHEGGDNEEEETAALAPPREPEMRDTLFFRVEGMTCASCVAMLENVVRHLPAVARVSVSLMTEEAEVEYVPHSGTTPDTIREAMSDLGFTVTRIDKAIQGKVRSRSIRAGCPRWRHDILCSPSSSPHWIGTDRLAGGAVGGGHALRVMCQQD